MDRLVIILWPAIFLPWICYYGWLWMLVGSASIVQRLIAGALAVTLALALALLMYYLWTSIDDAIALAGLVLLAFFFAPPLIAISVCGLLGAVLPEGAGRPRILHPALVLSPMVSLIGWLVWLVLLSVWQTTHWLWDEFGPMVM